MNQNKFLDVIAEILVRLGSKSPKLFVYIQWIAIGVGVVYGVLGLAIHLNVPLPEILIKIHSWEVVVEAAIAYIIAKLPVRDDASQLPLSK